VRPVCGSWEVSVGETGECCVLEFDAVFLRMPFGLLFALSLLCSLGEGRSLMVKDDLENFSISSEIAKGGDMVSMDMEFQRSKEESILRIVGQRLAS